MGLYYMIEQKVQLVGVKRVNFEQGSDRVQGTQVFYHSLEHENTPDVKGFIPNKAWLPLEHFPTYEKVNFPTPATGIFDVDLSKGKLKIKEFKAIGIK